MKRIILQRLQPKFAELVLKYMEASGMSQGQLAKFIGIGRNQLNPLIKGNPNRKLSAYYIRHFITRGVFKVNEIYDGKPETEKEELFWKKMKIAENEDLIEHILFLEENGVKIKEEIKLRAENIKKQPK